MIDTVQLVSLHETAFPPALDMPSAANLRRLAKALDADQAMQDVRYQAYGLATVRRECGPDYQIRSERGPMAYFTRYDPGTESGKRLGNTQSGDGFRFRGRGYVQLTGRAHYAHFSRLVDVDLVADPEAALKPEISYRILSLGMTRGLFTGKALSLYIAGVKCDYRSARRIINGLDHADEIAGDAVLFQGMLETCHTVSLSLTS